MPKPGRITMNVWRVGLSLMLILLSALAAQAELMSGKALYNKLSQIMVEEERGFPGGARNMTAVICPIVSEETLNQMYSDPDLREKVQYTYIEHDQSGRFSGPVRQWFLIKPLTIYSSYLLIITLADNGYCQATFMLDSL